MGKNGNKEDRTDTSGNPITFHVSDPSCSDLIVRNVGDPSLNRYLNNLEEWREKQLADLLLILKEGNDLYGEKRHRSIDSLDLVMANTNPRPNKSRKLTGLIGHIDGLDVDSPINSPPLDLSDKASLESYLREIDDYSPYSELYFSPKPPDSPTAVIEHITINQEINGLKDLLCLIDKYPLADNVTYNINMASLHRIKPNLQELDAMIGMHSLKDHVVDQILYYLQGFHLKGHEGDFMHTVIYGPPGTGKTEIAKIIGKTFSKLGVLSNDKFTKATRADLIAGYLGQTALKTRDVIKESIGGVLFIDEAYALGNPDKKDSFAKECIDTLCEGLSDHKKDLMVIVAGYEEELRSCFFAFNQGLDSRFTWRFKTDDYKASELRLIFEKKATDAGWGVDKGSLSDEWFEKNQVYFKYSGRDMETLFSKSKIAHSRRVFCLSEDEKTRLSKKDLDEGLKLYLGNEEVKKRGETAEFKKTLYSTMYL
jgi:hypothetical protein